MDSFHLILLFNTRLVQLSDHRLSARTWTAGLLREFFDIWLIKRHGWSQRDMEFFRGTETVSLSAATAQMI
jgi:hypothetical protein